MDSILAARYARALLSIGEEDGKYKEYGEELTRFAEAVDGARPESGVLESPVYPQEFRSRVLEAVIAKASLSGTVANFARLLFARGRINLLGEAARAYMRLTDERDGILRGTVMTPAPLADQDLDALREALRVYLGAASIELAQAPDPTLIAGIAVKVGDLVLDGSVKAQLKRLASAFAAD
ncbi:MAG: ATP synthase F1 subunit delta [Deltaproteobacteria bacterium]|jgi:F-type H+-transporting ATPase subunit delta|nr:ATP synthase F1 subunit delta [Deltaproteobacteria bacterium]